MGGRAWAVGLAALDVWARRHGVVLVTLALLLVGAAAVATANWVGHESSPRIVYGQATGPEALLFDIDCGSSSDPPYKDRGGYVAGKPGRLKDSVMIQGLQAGGPPAQAYRTFRQGKEVAYRFHVGQGWVAVELHFLEDRKKRKKRMRAFDIVLEGHRVARAFKVLKETFPRRALVRQWNLWVDDGVLDVRLMGAKSKARLSYLRVRRLEVMRGHYRRRGH